MTIIAHDDAHKDRKDEMSEWSYDTLAEMTTVKFAEILQEVSLFLSLC